MLRIAAIAIAMQSALFAVTPVPAFPGAEGAAMHTTGGRGGRVIAVTNLNDKGPGSLRAAIEAKGPRVVIFRVAGTIPLAKALRIKNGELTIAGQSAPGGGICVRNFGIDLTGSRNVIIRHLRIRPGDGAHQELDALSGLFVRT
jgi:pectate lyase